MALVSISEAARLVGKSKRTIYSDLHKGKLSASQDCTDGKSIDTSELIRVYGKIIAQNSSAKPVQSTQLCTPSETADLLQKIAILEAENRLLKDNLNDIRGAVKLLEHKAADSDRPWWKIW